MRGEDEISAGRTFHREGSFQEVALFKRNFTLREFARISIRNFFIMSCLFFTDSTLHVKMLRVIVWGKFSVELNCPEDISIGRGIFLWRWSQLSRRY